MNVLLVLLVTLKIFPWELIRNYLAPQELIEIQLQLVKAIVLDLLVLIALLVVLDSSALEEMTMELKYALLDISVPLELGTQLSILVLLVLPIIKLKELNLVIAQLVLMEHGACGVLLMDSPALLVSLALQLHLEMLLLISFLVLLGNSAIQLDLLLLLDLVALSITSALLVLLMPKNVLLVLMLLLVQLTSTLGIVLTSLLVLLTLDGVKTITLLLNWVTCTLAALHMLKNFLVLLELMVLQHRTKSLVIALPVLQVMLAQLELVIIVHQTLMWLSLLSVSLVMFVPKVQCILANTLAMEVNTSDPGEELLKVIAKIALQVNTVLRDLIVLTFALMATSAKQTLKTMN